MSTLFYGGLVIATATVYSLAAFAVMGKDLPPIQIAQLVAYHCEKVGWLLNDRELPVYRCDDGYRVLK